MLALTIATSISIGLKEYPINLPMPSTGKMPSIQLSARRTNSTKEFGSARSSTELRSLSLCETQKTAISSRGSLEERKTKHMVCFLTTRMKNTIWTEKL